MQVYTGCTYMCICFCWDTLYILYSHLYGGSNGATPITPKRPPNEIDVFDPEVIYFTNKVRYNDPVACSGKHWDHLAVKEGPGRLAVETENHGTILGSLV